MKEKLTNDFSKTNENDMIKMKLQELMIKADGEEKCTLCQAVRLLEKENTFSNFNIWYILIFMLCFGFGNFSNDNINLETILEAYTKIKENSNNNFTEALNDNKND